MSTPVPKLSKGLVYIRVFLNGHILLALMSKKYNSSVMGIPSEFINSVLQIFQH